jgi:hypothetical protein
MAMRYEFKIGDRRLRGVRLARTTTATTHSSATQHSSGMASGQQHAHVYIRSVLQLLLKSSA